MKTDKKLQKILLETDQIIGSSPVSAGLAGRVREKAARGRTVRIAVSAAVAAVLVVAIGIILLDSVPVSPVDSLVDDNQSQMAGVARATQTEEVVEVAVEVDPQQQIAQLQAEVALLRDEIDARMAIVEGMIARQEQRDTLAKLKRRLVVAGDPMEKIQQQRERAAYITVYNADYKYDQLDLKESAIKDYRRAIELFPKTIWAEQARKKLAEIEISREGDLL